MKVLVCGSRHWLESQPIYDRLKELKPDLVIHGDARGADRIAARVAEELGIRTQAFPADWSLGKRAGPKRNLEMLDQNPDLVLAFQLDNSRGTQHTIDNAKKREIPVEIHT